MAESFVQRGKGNNMLVYRRISVAYNFGKDSTHKTIALLLTVSIDDRSVYVFVGPFTILWLRKAALVGNRG